ncbi:ATP-binding cassette domain-containing protein [Roseibacillus ishigakijimensis]|uniref:ABC transporter ATP-binding protein n=1 Tax=Roseibacillus ishigakijimensis TaxID=454146 RepID=A0A934RJU6_9BACT|nr:ATP-binding cassette domain-containing protein [Roseibacillus ishigakijimensis]MBK1832754.1 ABC transporter ATP-binding protein [Roseibacillus ishigakijimensis]
MFLHIDDLKVHFPGKRGLFGQGGGETVKAVNGVSLKIQKGEILGLVGESGCGKSTLSRAVMQLISPTSGRITLEDRVLTELPRSEVRRHRLDFQMIFQDPYASLNPRMTVFSMLAEAIGRRHPGAVGHQAAMTDRVVELMRTVGLDPKHMRKYPHEFSGGQRQRVAIARALAPEPKLVIADEPVSALDVSIQSQILNLLLKLRDELELTMIFISHDLSVVRYLADNIAVMYAGEIVEYGEAEEVFNNATHPYTQKLLAAVPQIQAAG